MENINIILENVSQNLNQKLEQLDDLEAEKAYLIKQYSLASPTDRDSIIAEMNNSQERFWILNQEVYQRYEYAQQLKAKIGPN